MDLQQSEVEENKLMATISFKVTAADKARINDMVRIMGINKSFFFRQKANRILSSLNILK